MTLFSTLRASMTALREVLGTRSCRESQTKLRVLVSTLTVNNFTDSTSCFATNVSRELLPDANYLHRCFYVLFVFSGSLAAFPLASAYLPALENSVEPLPPFVLLPLASTRIYPPLSLSPGQVHRTLAAHRSAPNTFHIKQDQKQQNK
jgi:hypothetical protein